MVKLGKAFSILVVFALLILLAPAVILLPGENVAQAQGVVQEVEASFNFTEVAGGAWHSFQAGSAGIDPEGLCFAQFTRDNLLRTGPLSDCKFRNYTTASGTVAGVGLNGAITLAWQTWKFNIAYPYTPKYDGTATDFGSITGRGTIDEGGGDSFTFVFVGDYDSDDTVSSFAGKGFMVSVEENGRFGNMANPPEQRHKIIGDFDIALSGGIYTGNFHLRNYDPSEVFDLGILNVTGAVKQEDIDSIGSALELVRYDQDGSWTDADPTSFEEIAWGKDPSKTVNKGHLGAGGVMNISRNTALHLTFHPVGLDIFVHIGGTAACNLLIEDTYDVTGDDGTCHGDLWELLLLTIPYQELQVDEPPNFFNQEGYTFTPFGMLNPTTESYAGTESFAYANISIEATTVDAMQFSDDWAYGLWAHPKVASVTPSSGCLGETLNVVIKGKYFLRAGPDAPGGSWSLGSGITVHDWSLKNSSPIDNEIQAWVTIDPNAATTTRDVNVTACYAYDNVTNRQFMLGQLASAFTVNPLSGSTLQGQAGYISRGTPGLSWIEPFEVKGFEAGNLSNEIWNGTGITNTTGAFVITGLTPGTYDIGIKNRTCISELQTNVVLSSIAVVNFGNTREGDVKLTDKVDGFDYSLLSAAYNARPDDGNWDVNADLNRSGKVDGFDYSLLSGNYNVRGSAYGYF